MVKAQHSVLQQFVEREVALVKVTIPPLLFNAYSSLDLKQVVKRLKWTSVLNSYLL